MYLKIISTTFTSKNTGDKFVYPHERKIIDYYNEYELKYVTIPREEISESHPLYHARACVMRSSFDFYIFIRSYIVPEKYWRYFAIHETIEGIYGNHYYAVAIEIEAAEKELSADEFTNYCKFRVWAGINDNMTHEQIKRALISNYLTTKHTKLLMSIIYEHFPDKKPSPIINDEGEWTLEKQIFICSDIWPEKYWHFGATHERCENTRYGHGFATAIEMLKAEEKLSPEEFIDYCRWRIQNIVIGSNRNFEDTRDTLISNYLEKRHKELLMNIIYEHFPENKPASE